MRSPKAFDYSRWPILSKGGAKKPEVNGGQWQAWVCAGGQHDAIVCFGNSKDDVLALRRHLLSAVPVQLREPGKPRLVAQTYQCARTDGHMEYGFTFKLEGSEDAILDLPLGEVRPDDPDAAGTMRKEWKRMRWVADAICNAYPGAERAA